MQATTNTYCSFVQQKPKDDHHRIYHDTQYGFPINDDNELFGRLILEINQAGLSWDLILKKQENFRKAYSKFNIKKVAKYSEKDRERLLSNAGIIRNKLKINAAIYNANQILEMQKEHGSFQNWLDHHHPLSKEEWVKLFKKNFKFTGGEITNEFLMSTGYLPGAHGTSCEIYKKILELRPAWHTR
ncbi:MAG TPA: DNA-3-methyladenine glycosylase I [Bacteroidetes bacterium]|nr:DNA-3-methyladenine glycosylase I [Bacteroidota bacterium]